MEPINLNEKERICEPILCSGKHQKRAYSKNQWDQISVNLFSSSNLMLKKWDLRDKRMRKSNKNQSGY